MYRHVTLIDKSDEKITEHMNECSAAGEELISHKFSTTLTMIGLIGEKVSITHSFIWKSKE